MTTTIRRDRVTVYFISKIMTKLLSFHNQNYTIYNANEMNITKLFRALFYKIQLKQSAECILTPLNPFD